MILEDILNGESKIEDLVESLNFKTNITWTNNVGEFSINGIKFAMQVRAATPNEIKTFVPFFDKVPKIGNVEFSLITNDGKTTQETTGLLGNSAMKVFSVVAQGVAEEVERQGFDILLCVAKENSRANAYDIITDRAARKAGMLEHRLPEYHGTHIFVVFKYKYKDNILQIHEHFEKL